MIDNLLGSNLDAKKTYPLFQGYDSILSDSRSPAVTGEEGDWVGGGGEVSFKYIQDTLDFVDEQRTSMSAEIGLAGLFSVGGGLKFANAKRVTSLTTSIIILSKKHEGTLEYQDVQFKDGKSPDEANSITDFCRVYGDSFVSSFSKGGVFWLAYSFYAKSQQEKDELEAKMKADGIIKIVSFDLEAKAKFKKFMSSVHVEVEFKSGYVGAKDLKLPKTSDGLMQYAIDFQSVKLNAPVISDLEVKGYEQVEGGNAFVSVSKNRDYFVGKKGLSESSRGLLRDLSNIKRIKQQIEFTTRVYKRYGSFESDELKQALKDVEADLINIENKISEYQKSPDKPLKRLNLISLKWGRPEPNVEHHRTKKIGGNGGGAERSDFDEQNWRHFLPRICAIEMRSGSFGGPGPCINQLIVKLEKEYRTAERYEKTEDTIVHGEVSGEASDILTMNDGVSIKKAEARGGVFVDWLSFTNTQNSKIEGGGSGGSPSPTWDKGENTCFAGFTTRYGSHLDSINFNYFVLKPPIWPNRLRK